MTVTPDWLPGLPERNGVFLLRPLGPNTKTIHGMPAPDIPALFFEPAAGIRLCLMAGRNTPVTADDLCVRFPQLQHVGPLVDVPMASKAAQAIVDDAMRPRIEAMRCELEQLKTQYATCKAERDETLAMAKKINAAYEELQKQLLHVRQLEGVRNIETFLEGQKQAGTFTAQPEQFGGRPYVEHEPPYKPRKCTGGCGATILYGKPICIACARKAQDDTPPNTDDKDMMQP